MERQAYDYFAKIDELGGMVHAVKEGFPQREIAEAAYELQLRTDRGERIVVGVNDYIEGDDGEMEMLRIDPALERKQIDRLQGVRAKRDSGGSRPRSRDPRGRGRRRRQPAAGVHRRRRGPRVRRGDRGGAAGGVGLLPGDAGLLSARLTQRDV